MSPVVAGAIVVVLVIIVLGLRIAQEYERAVVFTLGRFSRIAGPGLYWIIPYIQTQRMLDIRTATVNIEQQETITRDSVTIRVNAVLWFRVKNPQRAVIQVVNYAVAVNQAALTSLRNVIGQHYLDEVLQERDKINAMLKQLVDKSTSEWGVEVVAVEMKDVEIPASMQRAMAQEAEAVREKRARLIKAQAEFEASERLADAAQQILKNPAALELRRMQMIAEVGAEHNSTTVVLIPSDFVNMAKAFTDQVNSHIKKDI